MRKYSRIISEISDLGEYNWINLVDSCVLMNETFIQRPYILMKVHYDISRNEGKYEKSVPDFFRPG